MSDIQQTLAKMREPFLPAQISQMCRSTKKDNPKGKCPKCGGWHGLPAIQLEYVGHAMLTHRMLEVDPLWTWEPLALDAMGYPAIDKDGGMWIKLTIAGVTRLGYGDAQGKVGGDAMKERIGDALRNAAMRFGAALDLWHKGDLYAGDADDKPEGNKEDKKKPPKDAPQSDKTDVPEKVDVQTKLGLELSEFCNHDAEKMTAILKNISYYKKNEGKPDEKEGWLTMDNLTKPTDHAGILKWIGSSLGKLRILVEESKSEPDPF
jgi:hypothetical protein